MDARIGRYVYVLWAVTCGLIVYYPLNRISSFQFLFESATFQTMSNISPHLCEEARGVADSVSFKVLIVVKMILAALGSIFILVLFKKKVSKCSF